MGCSKRCCPGSPAENGAPYKTLQNIIMCVICKFSFIWYEILFWFIIYVRSLASFRPSWILLSYIRGSVLHIPRVCPPGLFSRVPDPNTPNKDEDPESCFCSMLAEVVCSENVPAKLVLHFYVRGTDKTPTRRSSRTNLEPRS